MIQFWVHNIFTPLTGKSPMSYCFSLTLNCLTKTNFCTWKMEGQASDKGHCPCVWPYKQDQPVFRLFFVESNKDSPGLQSSAFSCQEAVIIRRLCWTSAEINPHQSVLVLISSAKPLYSIVPHRNEASLLSFIILEINTYLPLIVVSPAICWL